MIPVYFLRTTNLPTSERWLILTLFASTFLTLAVCILHAVFVIERYSSGLLFSPQLEVCLDPLLLIGSIWTLDLLFSGISIPHGLQLARRGHSYIPSPTMPKVS